MKVRKFEGSSARSAIRRADEYEVQIRDLKALLVEARSLFDLTRRYADPNLGVGAKKPLLEQISGILKKIDRATTGARR